MEYYIKKNGKRKRRGAMPRLLGDIMSEMGWLASFVAKMKEEAREGGCHGE